MLNRPSELDLHAYLTGSLDPELFAQVDAWLASASDEEAEAALSGCVDSLPDLSAQFSFMSVEQGFQAARSRVVPGEILGQGGMAQVVAAHDRLIDRMVALKVLSARRPDEDLLSYYLRDMAFRREAALTATLDHPAIPPVYDVGVMGGRPAFTMKLLTGCTFEALLEMGEQPQIYLVQLLTRVAEAVASAHVHGIVHRDLSPRNILIGDFGAVYVVDWGLAARVGEDGGMRVGTPGWRSPEQEKGAAADPGMDVWALGALLHRALTGVPPDESLLSAKKRRIPIGLRALIERCLQADPKQRYMDAQDVASELHRWMDQGLTLAQGAGAVTKNWIRFRRSPRARAAFAATLLASVLAVGVGWWLIQGQRNRVEERVRQITAEVPLDRPEALSVALDEVAGLRQRWPKLTDVAALEARLQAAKVMAEHHSRLDLVRTRLQQLLARTRLIGPWADQRDSWRSALRESGLALGATTRAADMAAMRNSAIGDIQAESLAFLWRAQRDGLPNQEAVDVATLLAEGGPNPGWKALGRLLQKAPFLAHDPLLVAGDDTTRVLENPEAAAIALALFSPDPRLTAYAQQRLAQAPGDFWALMAAGRAALVDHDVHEAQHLAFIASGAEPGSLLPRLLLAYVSLLHEDWPALKEEVGRGLETDPSNVELITLQAVALVHLGNRAAAQTLVDHIPAGHLRYHLAHQVGHPMELAVDALVNAGLYIAEASPDLGPLAPLQHVH